MTFSFVSIYRKEDVEKCKQKDILEQTIEQMTGEFPALGRVFVSERDIFLAHSLRKATQPILHPTQGKSLPKIETIDSFFWR